MPSEPVSIIALLRRLTPEERLIILNEFCSSCGDENPGCQCSNDE